MPRFVSLLRGINVGGHRKIRMAALKAAYEALGLTNVSTYLQSGNVVFDAKMQSASKVIETLEAQIQSKFGFGVHVMVRTPGDFERIVKTNPYSVQAGKDPTKVHVTFLASRPPAGIVKRLEIADSRGDEFFVAGAEVFLHLPNGAGKTKLNNTFFERKLGMHTTSRNWKTVIAVHDLVVGS